MAEDEDDGGGKEGDAGDASGGPFNADQIDRVAVGEVRLDAGDRLAGLLALGHVDQDPYLGVQIREGVSDARNLRDGALGGCRA